MTTCLGIHLIARWLPSDLWHYAKRMQDGGMRRAQLRVLNVCDVLRAACHCSPTDLSGFMSFHMAATVTRSKRPLFPSRPEHRLVTGAGCRGGGGGAGGGSAPPGDKHKQNSMIPASNVPLSHRANIGAALPAMTNAGSVFPHLGRRSKFWE